MQQPISHNFRYTISISKNDLIVQFRLISKYYIKDVSLLQQNQLPLSITEKYELQVHPTWIKFRSLKPQLLKDHSELIEELRILFNHIKIYVIRRTKLDRDDRYRHLCNMINIRKGFRCHKLIWESETENKGIKQDQKESAVGKKNREERQGSILIKNQPNPSNTIIRKEEAKLEAGDLILFYEKSNQQDAECILKKIRNFQEEQLVYMLDQYFLNSGLMAHQSFEVQDGAAKGIIKEFYEEIKALTQKAKLTLLMISSTDVSKIQGIQGSSRYKYGLKFKVLGESKKFIQYYFNIDAFLRVHYMKVVRVDEVRCCKVSQLKKHSEFSHLKMVIISNGVFGFFDLKQTPADLQRKLKTGAWLLNKQFSEKELQTLLELEHILRQQLHIQGIIVQNLRFAPGGIVFCADKEIKKDFIRICLNLLENKKKVQSPCPPFTSSPEFITQIFLKHYAQDVEKKFGMKFKMEDGNLLRVNFQSNNDDVFNEMGSIHKQIISKIVRVPTLAKPQTNKYCRISQNPKEYKLQNIDCLRYKLPNSKIFISLAPFDGANPFTSPSQVLMFLINDDIKVKSIFSQLLAEVDQTIFFYLEKAKSKRNYRVKGPAEMDSKRCRNLMSWYINTENYSARRIQEDLSDVALRLSEFRKVNIVLPGQNHQLIGRDLYKLLETISKNERISEKQSDQPLELILLYETEKERQQSKRMFSRMQAKARNLWYANLQRIERVSALDYYKFSYYQQQKTKRLSALNSFVFNHERMKTQIMSKQVPIALPKPKVICEKQYLFDYENDVYYTIGKFGEIKTHKTKISDIKHTEISLILKLLKKYFIKLEYFVLPIPIGANVKFLEMINFFNAVPNSSEITRISLDLEEQKVIIREQKIEFNNSQTNYIEWFVVETHELQLAELRKEVFQRNR